MARCECTACGRIFSSVSSFDKHRTGKHGKDRRCMTDGEMAVSRLRLDSRGVFRDGSGGRYRPKGDRRF